MGRAEHNVYAYCLGNLCCCVGLPIGVSIVLCFHPTEFIGVSILVILYMGGIDTIMVDVVHTLQVTNSLYVFCCQLSLLLDVIVIDAAY